MKYLALLALGLTGCSNTAEAIAPASIEDMLIGMGADVEQWIEWIGSAMLFVGL